MGTLTIAGGNGEKRQPREPKEPKEPKGRQGHDKHDAVIQTKLVGDKVEALVKLKVKADEAAEDFAAAVKKTAEASGMLATVVRRFVIARAGEKFEEKKRECEQLDLLFSEVGE